jgi:hypothetical protein
VVALEVAEVGVGAEHLEDEGGQGELVGGEGRLGAVLGVVDEGPLDIELDLVFVPVPREGFPVLGLGCV